MKSSSFGGCGPLAVRVNLCLMITATQSGYGGMGAEVSKEVVPHPGAAAEARRALEELRAAWFYPDPASPFEDLRDHVAFYPSKMDACWVDGEKVEAQPEIGRAS